MTTNRHTPNPMNSTIWKEYRRLLEKIGSGKRLGPRQRKRLDALTAYADACALVNATAGK